MDIVVSGAIGALLSFFCPDDSGLVGFARYISLKNYLG